MSFHLLESWLVLNLVSASIDQGQGHFFLWQGWEHQRKHVCLGRRLLWEAVWHAHLKVPLPGSKGAGIKSCGPRGRADKTLTLLAGHLPPTDPGASTANTSDQQVGAAHWCHRMHRAVLWPAGIHHLEGRSHVHGLHGLHPSSSTQVQFVSRCRWHPCWMVSKLRGWGSGEESLPRNRAGQDQSLLWV